MEKKIRVVVADDHSAIRLGIRAMLKSAKEIEIVAEAKNGLEALQNTLQYQPDLLLLDIEMPELNGRQVVDRLRKAESKTKILILSAHADKEYIRSMMGKGVQGYLIKDEAPHTIITAIREVARGQRWWRSPLVAELARE